MHTQDIRRRFLKFFKDRDHTVVPSSPVVPHGDPTLLFTNAGMNQFKDVFLGSSKRDYDRAASAQKCIRVGGKHNDLENVGHTSRHLTFFEMLGNFSFGSYFKKEAIAWAWQMSTEVFGFDPEKIYATVFETDDEAYELWKAWLPETRISRLGEKDNFWSMGETGPCGPCSELFYDLGAERSSAKSPLEDPEGKRFLEFWNLVFMQYDRKENGALEPLPRPSIDTGAGLERVVALKMGVDSVFETDVLRGIIAEIERLSGRPYVKSSKEAPSFHVIADHLRALAFSIADGVKPSNLDRGYILRKVLRRAVRYGKQIGFEAPFLAKLLPTLSTLMSDYPELASSQAYIGEILTQEEEGFFRTLKRGGTLLQQVVDRAKDTGVIRGEDAFKLKDTYGLPFEEIILFAIDSDLKVDETRFFELEEEAKDRSRASKKDIQETADVSFYQKWVEDHGPTEFLGFETAESDSVVLGILINGELSASLGAGKEAVIFSKASPFYAEKGGQVGDTGLITTSSAEFLVTDTVSPYKGLIAHVGKLLSGSLKTGEKIHLQVDDKARGDIARHHTATHLLHWALGEVLGAHIRQAGSLVEKERLRFDFTHHKSLTPEEISEIEHLVNEKIRTNAPVKTYEVSYEKASSDACIKQFFGEKYDSVVRVVDAEFSKELCGGIHVPHLGTIGTFRIVKEGSVAAGVRRIEAVVGLYADRVVKALDHEMLEIAALLKAPVPQIKDRVVKLLEEKERLEAQLAEMEKENLDREVERLSAIFEKVGDAYFLSGLVASDKDLKTLGEKLREKHADSLVVLGSKSQDRAFLLVALGDQLCKKAKAGDLLQKLLPYIEGKGGGRPTSAQGAGSRIEGLNEALDAARKLI